MPNKQSTICVVALSFLLSIFAGPVRGVFAQDTFLPQLIKQCQPKMAKIIGAGAGRVDGYASGIVVGADGMILTSQGVFLDGRQVRVELSDGKSYPATILRRNRTLQLLSLIHI